MTSLPPDHGALQDIGGLARLPGLDTVRDQLAEVIAVIQAENARREAGIPVTRPRWKNLVFTGGPGSGKSRAAAAVGRIYQDLGVLTSGHVIEVVSAELTDITTEGTAKLTTEAASRARGGVLLLTDAHALAGLQLRDQQVLRCLNDALTRFRDDLIIILSGEASKLHTLLHANPALPARFPVVIDFPGYSSSALAAIFYALAAEAGFTLTPSAAQKVSVTIKETCEYRSAMGAWLAVELLDQATVRQGLRIAAAQHQVQDPSEPATIRAIDIPHRLRPVLSAPTDSQWPGQYL